MKYKKFLDSVNPV